MNGEKLWPRTYRASRSLLASTASTTSRIHGGSAPVAKISGGQNLIAIDRMDIETTTP
jgi:hypothetical protein